MSEQELNENVQETPAVEAPVEKKQEKKHPFRLGFLIGMLVMLLLCVSVFFTLLLTRRLYLSGGEGIIDSQTLTKAEEIYGFLDKYSIYEFGEDDLRAGVYEGILDATGDKYTEYYTPEEIRDLFADYNGDFCGIGVLIKVSRDGDYYISGVYDDSPAKDAGFEEGDIIKLVDGVGVDDVDKATLTDMIRGPEDTEVVVTVYRSSTDETLDLKAFRKQLKKIDVSYEMLTDTIGYIWIKDFDDVTTDQFSEAVRDLTEQGMTDMVLDLRMNTGGLFRVALEIADQLMSEGVIVSIEGADGAMKEYSCDDEDEFAGNIVILTDGYTASSSEILAGALIDNGKAISVGTTSFGKGLVQDFFYLNDGSCIKFTTNQYYTPGGTAINGVGIVPEIEVELDVDLYYDEGRDTQVEAAVEYLENL